MRSTLGALVAAVATVTLSALPLSGTATAAVPTTNVFPIAHSGAACAGSYGDPRPGGRTHEGDDCFSPAGIGTPIVAVEAGVVDRHTDPSGCATSTSVSIRGTSGTRYYFGHLNARYVGTGGTVARGQVIGTLGQTGNAHPSCGGGGPHLHFELRPDGTNTVDPYPYLITWPKVGGGGSDAHNPFGRFDSLAARGGGAIGLYGWAMDPDQRTAAIAVHVYVTASNGVRTYHPDVANGYRPDVGSAYPGYGNNHGWDTVIGGLPRGSTKVEVYGIDASGVSGGHTLLGTRWVTVT